MISRDFVQQLITGCDITDVISSYINIKRIGINSKALCPFHSEKTPSFVVYSDTQSFYCFGCGAGGDALSFIMRAENLDYVEAIHFLAKRNGITVPDDGEGNDQMKLKQTILSINRETAKFFNMCLKQPIGQKGYSYFKGRGIEDKTISEYGLGFAPDSWDALLNYLKSKGYSESDMLSAGVIVKGKTNSFYDQFRNRAMFPIIDMRGNVIAFGGRVLDDSKPKYLNSADTMVFKKSRNLFSLNLAKNQIKDTLILAEGYMDVIAIYAAGFKNVVATLGTSLTEEQARLMSKYAKNVVIAFDSDEAGQKAIHRAINILSAAGITTKALKMDGAKDPDEYIKKFGAKRFELLITGAVDVIDYELSGLRAKVDMATVSGKAEYLNKSINILADIENKLSREVYATSVALESGAMPQSVAEQANQLRNKKYYAKEKREWRDIEVKTNAPRDKINPQKKDNMRGAMAEEGIIAFLFKHSDCIKTALTKINTENFITDFNKKVFAEIVRLWENNEEINLSMLSSEFSHEEIGAISGILARNSNISNNMDTLTSYIDSLIECSQRLSKEDVLNIDLSDLELYRQKLKNKNK